MATTATQKQLTNALQDNRGPKTWGVESKWSADARLKLSHVGLTHRQAKALARSMREGCGFANAVRVAA